MSVETERLKLHPYRLLQNAQNQWLLQSLSDGKVFLIPNGDESHEPVFVELLHRVENGQTLADLAHFLLEHLKSNGTVNVGPGGTGRFTLLAQFVLFLDE